MPWRMPWCLIPVALLALCAARAPETKLTRANRVAMYALLSACECSKKRPLGCSSWQEHVVGALAHAPGATVLVVGANEGSTTNDPLWRHYNSSALRHVHKVFVEPIPLLHRALQANIASMPHAVAVRAAISPDPAVARGSLPMYCLLDPESGKSKPGQHTGLKGWQGWWSQICSLDRARLFAEYDMQRVLGTLAPGSEGARKLDRAVRNVTVPTLSLAELLRKYVEPSAPLLYVQIDVEGFDDRVLAQLPLGASGVRPAAVAFEWVLLSEARFRSAIGQLAAAGYAACLDGQNVIGLRPRSPTSS